MSLASSCSSSEAEVVAAAEMEELVGHMLEAGMRLGSTGRGVHPPPHTTVIMR